MVAPTVLRAKKKDDTRLALLFITPALIGFLVFMVWPTLRGIYLSLPAPLFDTSRHRAYCYPLPMNELVRADPAALGEPDLLFSFVGTMTHPVRRSVLALRHERAYIEQNKVDMFTVDSAQIRGRKREFAQVLGRSKFVICPRGMGTASIRMFESLRLGRVPVIISDGWVEPSGPDWSCFSLRVREDEVASVPALLEENEHRWPEMSRAARQAHDDWFGPQVMFHRIAEYCAQILAQDTLRSSPKARQFIDFAARNLTIRARVRAGASRALLKKSLKRGR